MSSDLFWLSWVTHANKIIFVALFFFFHLFTTSGKMRTPVLKMWEAIKGIQQIQEEGAIQNQREGKTDNDQPSPLPEQTSSQIFV